MSLQQNRDLNSLTPQFRSKVEKRLARCPEVFVTEAYRSQARQNYLYSLGRTRRGRIVTYTTRSVHTQRKAVDIAFRGGVLYPREHWKRRKVADVGKECGIDRGYDLRGRDKPHYQDDNKPLQQKRTGDQLLAVDKAREYLGPVYEIPQMQEVTTQRVQKARSLGLTE